MEELMKRWPVIVFEKVILAGIIGAVAVYIDSRLEHSKFLNQLEVEMKSKSATVKSQVLVQQFPILVTQSAQLMALVSDVGPVARISPAQYKQLYGIQTQLWVSANLIGAVSSAKNKERLLALHAVSIRLELELLRMRQANRAESDAEKSDLVRGWELRQREYMKDIREATKETVDAMQKLIAHEVQSDLQIVSEPEKG